PRRTPSRIPHLASRIPLANDVELRLAPQDPVHPAVGPELRVLFLRGPHRLVAPFRQWRRGLELDGEPGVGDQSDVAASGHSLLVVPQTDERPGAVPAVADRVGVDRGGPRWITTAPESERSTPRRCTSTSVWNQVPNPRSFTR